MVREERYIVIKLKPLTHMQERRIRACLYSEGVELTESVVVESTWPEYEQVWQLLEKRSNPDAQA